jgi:hypothetical protein
VSGFLGLPGRREMPSFLRARLACRAPPDAVSSFSLGILSSTNMICGSVSAMSFNRVLRDRLVANLPQRKARGVGHDLQRPITRLHNGRC